MRTLSILMLTLGASTTAAAHTLPDDVTLIERLAHQLAGVHHLPITLLLIICASALLSAIRARSKHNSRGR